MGKTVFITGASSGFDEACAMAFAKQEHTPLILTSRNMEKLQSLANKLGTLCKVHVASLVLLHFIFT